MRRLATNLLVFVAAWLTAAPELASGRPLVIYSPHGAEVLKLVRPSSRKGCPAPRSTGTS